MTPTMHISCSDEQKYQIVEKLTREFQERYSVITVNGARVLFDNGWGLVRASSNEQKLVLVFEGKTQQDIKEYKSIFRNTFSKYSEIGSEWENE